MHRLYACVYVHHWKRCIRSVSFKIKTLQRRLMALAGPSRPSPRPKALHQLVTTYLSSFISHFSLLLVPHAFHIGLLSVPPMWQAHSCLRAFAPSVLSTWNHLLQDLLIIWVSEMPSLLPHLKYLCLPDPSTITLSFFFLHTYHHLKLFCIFVYLYIIYLYY